MSAARGRLAACLLLALAGCAGVSPREGGGRREVTIDAEGWAPIAGEDALSARKRALAEAQKKAVEKAVGVTLRARTRVDDAISVKQSIEANMGGTIRRYEITSQGEDGGFFKVRIRAVVIYQALEPPARSRAPLRLSVRIASDKAAGAVRSALSSRDFDIVGAEAAADVAVTGVVETRGLSDPRLGGFYSYTAKVTLTAVNLRTGKVGKVEYEASAVDTDEQEAVDRALENAGDESGAELAATLSESAGASGGAAELSDARESPQNPPAGDVPPL